MSEAVRAVDASRAAIDERQCDRRRQRGWYRRRYRPWYHRFFALACSEGIDDYRI